MAEKKDYVPVVPPSDTKMREFTLRALLIGLFMSVILGAANAYLGLKAGMTIAAVYPAAVVGMALLRIVKGSILEENLARTVGAIGESVAAGAIFTLPAFFIAGFWDPFFTAGNYLTSTIIMIVGGILGIMFVALLRRVMVRDPELAFPESVAAAEIHKAGRAEGGGSKFLFRAMGVGAVIKLLAEVKLFAVAWEKFVIWGKQTIAGTKFTGQGGMFLGSFGVKPAYIGVGYIIGPMLGSLAFAGGLLAWGLLTPIILYFMGPSLVAETGVNPTNAAEWLALAKQVWMSVVRPIAIGGMLVGATYTLFKMRKSLTEGIARSVADVKKAASGTGEEVERTEQDIRFPLVLAGIFGVSLATFAIMLFIFKAPVLTSLVASALMTILAFFFAAVSGYLVGVIGSSNNPISGLTLTALLVTALVLVILGIGKGDAAIMAVLGVAAIVCVSAAVAGEMLQDLKSGHILGGTPWKMEVGNIIGVIASGAVLFGVLAVLHSGDVARGEVAGYQGGFGTEELPAPQASLMAILARGIVGGDMAWPLIIVGIFMGIGFVLANVKSPMLVSVGMYLPFTTTFAIFIGGMIKGLLDVFRKRYKHNEAQKARSENVGILLASGLIAGEALMGLLIAFLAIGGIFIFKYFVFFENPSFLISLPVIFLVAWILIRIPLKNAGSPDEPAPPSAAGH
ncbi:MAG: oligopeptide transporter, OPT family [Acidobacteriota bacterium]|nr:oligopeptide transporter, OPT family [Acidobacteriota bacterium]